jgi:hypothetical protein
VRRKSLNQLVGRFGTRENQPLWDGRRGLRGPPPIIPYVAQRFVSVGYGVTER